MVDEPDYVGYIHKIGGRRLSIHIPPDMIDALPVGVTELYSRTPSAPSAVGEFIARIHAVTPNGEWVMVKHHPNGDWSVANASYDLKGTA